MKKILGVLALTFALAACSGTNEATVGGSVDLNIQDNLSQCEVRQNGTTLLVRQTGLDPFVFAFDPSVTYKDTWVGLTIADADRVTPLTPIEFGIVYGNR